jgi:nucleotide-binding universal stress UspA family protein
VARIVVGVDASPGALRALAWAADEARLRLASLQVVHAHQAQALEGLLDEMGETVEGIDVQRTVVEDRSPAEAPVELSADADLLVVGSRGRGGFTSLLLGSVSHAAVLHAMCPVVVIPPGAEDRKPAAPPRMARSEARP